MYFQNQFQGTQAVESFVHTCHRSDGSDYESRSRHNSASCGGCSDCEAAGTLLAMHSLGNACSVIAAAPRKPVLPPRLRYRKMYKESQSTQKASREDTDGSNLVRELKCSYEPNVFVFHFICV